MITGQAHFASHLAARVEVAVVLVNALATAQAHGREVKPAADPDELRDRAGQALREAGAQEDDLDADEAVGLQQLAARLREVFAALDDGREDDAAEVLNLLLARSAARPHLHRHPPEPWHLHFHRPEAGLVQGWSAGCATGLAYVLGSGHAASLGICAAPSCDRVFIDVSRNGLRRFCSTLCQNRVKAAAHRARGKPKSTTRLSASGR